MKKTTLQERIGILSAILGATFLMAFLGKVAIYGLRDSEAELWIAVLFLSYFFLGVFLSMINQAHSKQRRDKLEEEWNKIKDVNNER